MSFNESFSVSKDPQFSEFVVNRYSSLTVKMHETCPCKLEGRSFIQTSFIIFCSSNFPSESQSDF